MRARKLSTGCSHSPLVKGQTDKEEQKIHLEITATTEELQDF